MRMHHAMHSFPYYFAFDKLINKFVRLPNCQKADIQEVHSQLMKLENISQNQIMYTLLTFNHFGLIILQNMSKVKAI